MRNLKSARTKLSFVATILALCVSSVIADDLVCRRPGIAGFDEAARKAKRYVGSETESVSETEVYISVESGTLYLHSNYVTSGYDNPTKIATDRVDMDVRVLALNLIGVEEESGVSARSFIREFPNMTFYVEEHVFTDPKFRKLDFNKARNINIISSDAVARPARQLISSNKKVDWIIQCRTDAPVYTRLGKTNIQELNSRLNAQPFQQENLRLLSLVTDTRTNQRIKEKFPAVNRIEFDLSSVETLKQQLSAHRNQTVIVLGHVEGDTFVTLNADNSEAFRVSFSQLENIAREYNIKFFPLGCKSAASHPVGAPDAFNTLDAVEHLHAAFSANPRNYGEFIDRFASHNQNKSKLALVIDESILEPERITIRTTIHKGGGPGEPILPARPVGSLTISFSGSASNSTPIIPLVNNNDNANRSAANRNNSGSANNNGNGSQDNADQSDSLPILIWLILGGLFVVVAVIVFRKRQ